MKISVEIECTPAEARDFFGLPDVRPVQEAATEAAKQRVAEMIGGADPQELFRTWFSSGAGKAMADGLATLQKAFWAQAGQPPKGDNER
ncbi:MAG: DUF6489 family protein [Alphaproteobacteria bacterium]